MLQRPVTTTQPDNNTAEAFRMMVIEMYMVERKTLLERLAHLEDKLIQLGQIERRTKPPRVR